MERQLTARQTGLLLIVSILANKLLMLPGIISFGAGNNAFVVFFLSFLIDFLFLMLFLYLMYKLDMPILEYITKRFGKVFAIILSIPIIITFAFKCVDVFGECYLFFEQVMYVDVDQIIFMVCFLIMILYLGSRSFRTLGRTFELLFFIFVTSLFLSLYMSIGNTDMSNLLPIFSINLNNLFSLVFSHNLWFGDFFIMFFLIGNIKFEKTTARHILIDYLIGIAIVMSVVIIFTSVFGKTASIHRMAIIDITASAPRLQTEGRLNWVIDLVFPIVNVLGLGIYANMGTKALEYALPKKISTNLVSVTIFAAIVFSFAIMSNTSFPNLYSMIVNFGSYVSFVSQFVLPIILVLLCVKKENAYDKKVIK